MHNLGQALLAGEVFVYSPASSKKSTLHAREY